MNARSRRSNTWVAATLAACAFTGEAQASVVYSTAASSYTQNFDSLPNTPTNVSLGNSPTGWIDDTASPASGNFSIVGWYLYHPTSTTEGGSNGHQRFRISTGSGTTGSYYSFGATSSTERALGDVGANTLAPDGQTGNDAGNIYFALRITNSTGSTLDSFKLGYTGEQWRDGGVSTTETMTFGYSTTATASSSDSTFFGKSTNITNVPALAWTTPKATAAAATLDGNAAANRVVLSPVTITGLNWADGTDLWLRWTDPQLSGNVDSGLSIDDLTFSADVAPSPEPASIAFLASGAVLLGLRRRTR